MEPITKLNTSLGILLTVFVLVASIVGWGWAFRGHEDRITYNEQHIANGTKRMDSHCISDLEEYKTTDARQDVVEQAIVRIDTKMDYIIDAVKELKNKD